MSDTEQRRNADTGRITIPEADYENWYDEEGDEVVDLTCPVAGCEWRLPYSWGDMEDRRPDEYVAHYQAEHIDGDEIAAQEAEKDWPDDVWVPRRTACNDGLGAAQNEREER